MQKKNTRRPTVKKKSASTSSKPDIHRLLLVITLLIAVVTVSAIVAHFLIPRKKSPLPVEKPVAKTSSSPSHYEIYPKESSPQPSPPPSPSQPPAPGALPKAAIIIDDMGFDPVMTRKFLQLDAVLTYAILPFSPLQSEIQEATQMKKREIMLHLPMEPIEYPMIQPGRGALLMSMSPDALIEQLKKNLDAVPGIVGVNNHMGSRMTADSDRMNQIFSVLKKEGVFFIDSKTTPTSLCRPAARLFRMPFGERDVFLDHVQKPEIIRGQVLQLIRIATTKGEAIGIGHPHESTYDVLREMLPEITRKVRLVRASEVVHLPVP